jgi:hypothetical protein
LFIELIKDKIRTQIKCRKLYTDSISEKSVEILDNYIDGLNDKEYERFCELLESFIYNRKYRGQRKYMITNNSVSLTIKILNEVGHKVFPYINKVATKGWNLSGGTMAWSMFDLNVGKYELHTEIYCDFRVKDCLKKNSKIVFNTVDQLTIQ